MMSLLDPFHPPLSETRKVHYPCAVAATALSSLPPRLARLGRTTGGQLVQELAELLLG
jgi:hypothetical protein